MRDVDPVENTYVEVVMDEVHPGSKWGDTREAEIEVRGAAE
jgi:hypothetical protein